MVTTRRIYDNPHTAGFVLEFAKQYEGILGSRHLANALALEALKGLSAYACDRIYGNRLTYLKKQIRQRIAHGERGLCLRNWDEVLQTIELMAIDKPHWKESYNDKYWEDSYSARSA